MLASFLVLVAASRFFSFPLGSCVVMHISTRCFATFETMCMTEMLATTVLSLRADTAAATAQLSV